MQKIGPLKPWHELETFCTKLHRRDIAPTGTYIVIIIIKTNSNQLETTISIVKRVSKFPVWTSNLPF